MKNRAQHLNENIKTLNKAVSIVSRYYFTTTTEDAINNVRYDFIGLDEDIRNVREYLIDELEKELEKIK